MSRRQMKKIFWGVLFLLGALALLLGKLGYLEGLGFWSVFFSIVLLGVLIDGVLRKSFGEILFPLAGLAIVNDELLHLEEITPWPVLGAALLGTIGLSIIFPRRKRWKKHAEFKHLQEVFRNGAENGEISGEKIYYEVSFGSGIKYISGQDVSRVILECSFGSLEVYFNDAVLKDYRANVVAACSFGSMDLYVPMDWKVVMNMPYSFGSVNEDGDCNPNGENVLFVEGGVSFGSITIHYI